MKISGPKQYYYHGKMVEEAAKVLKINRSSKLSQTGYMNIFIENTKYRNDNNLTIPAYGSGLELTKHFDPKIFLSELDQYNNLNIKSVKFKYD